MQGLNAGDAKDMFNFIPLEVSDYRPIPQDWLPMVC
jgi:hypothetical protein